MVLRLKGVLLLLLLVVMVVMVVSMVVSMVISILRKNIRENFRGKKSELEAILWIDGSNLKLPYNDFVMYDWQRIKVEFEKINKIKIGQKEYSELGEFYGSLTAENDTRSITKRQEEGKTAAEALKQLMPYVTLTILDKTYGDTPESGARRTFVGFSGLVKTDNNGLTTLTYDRVAREILRIANEQKLTYT